LGEDIFDGFGAARVVPALFAVATEGEIGGGVGEFVVNGVVMSGGLLRVPLLACPAVSVSRLPCS
jgi:hypothetical protein